MHKMITSNPNTLSLQPKTKQFFNITGILAEKQVFEHKCMLNLASIAHFAIARDSLVGVDRDEGAAHGEARQIGDAHIGNL